MAKKTEALDPGTPELLQTIGERVRALRTSAGINQTELANAVGLHQTYVTLLETGTQNMSVDVLQRLSRKFDRPIRSFFPAEDGDLDGVADDAFRHLVGVVQKLAEAVESRQRKDVQLSEDISKLLVSINARLERSASAKSASAKSDKGSAKVAPPKKHAVRSRK